MADTLSDSAHLPPAVAAAFEVYPTDARDYLLRLRLLIFETAKSTAGVGQLTETLKWGEPSFLTDETRAGTSVRLAWKKDNPRAAQLLVNCQTSLIEDWRNAFGDLLAFSGNRAVLLDLDAPLPKDALAACIGQALTYHLRKKKT